MRIALTGASGQLGTALQPLLGATAEVVPLKRPEFDLADTSGIRQCLDDARPDMLINTAAYNFVDRAESEPEAAFQQNAFGPRTLAVWCAEHDVPLMHFSTDYVFGLETHRQTPYTEDDAPGPLSVYAASKLQGEYFVRSLCPRHFVIRTCGLFGQVEHSGRGKGNFIETMLRLGSERDTISVVDDQQCAPTATADLAAAAVDLMNRSAYGLYHATSSGSATWYELATLVMRLAGRPATVVPVSSQDFAAAARRPRYSVLDCRKLQSVIGRPMPDWRDAVSRYLDERRPDHSASEQPI